ncbi:hypothetical protein D3C87_2121070 [compost metagenome]
MTREITDILADETDPLVAAGAALTSAALYCVCAGMTDDEITRNFDVALQEARGADDARGAGVEGRAN